MEFNKKILYQSYKPIVKTCITDGYNLPVLIKKAKIPHQYVYNLEQKKGFLKKTDDSTRARIYDMMMERKKELNKIRNNESNFKTADEYYEYELMEFIKEYSEFKNIIK